eukprot:2744057-Pyramimonas_sp.AAC.1
MERTAGVCETSDQKRPFIPPAQRGGAGGSGNSARRRGAPVRMKSENEKKRRGELNPSVVNWVVEGSTDTILLIHTRLRWQCDCRCKPLNRAPDWLAGCI